jgi:opacity protein-like surface antigen
MKRIISALLLILSCVYLQAQDDLMNLFGDEEKKTTEYTTSAFKASRIILGQSIENAPHGALTFVIQHHFGRINDGWYEFWGLDQANIRFVFEYGITDWLSLELGRTSIEKTFDGAAKVKLLRQSTGARNMPLSLTYYGNVGISSLEWSDPERTNYFSSRMSFVNQLLIARKFSSSLSLQLTPTFVHRNLVETIEDDNDVWSIGAGGRYKVSQRVSVNAEYYYLLPGTTADEFYDSFSIGVDLETGGHVFQVFLTNSVAMLEQQFIPETTGNWLDGDIHIGFNINRNFQIKKPKEIPVE